MDTIPADLPVTITLLMRDRKQYVQVKAEVLAVGDICKAQYRSFKAGVGPIDMDIDTTVGRALVLYSKTPGDLVNRIAIQCPGVGVFGVMALLYKLQRELNESIQRGYTIA